jgi:hypothetical protein
MGARNQRTHNHEYHKQTGRPTGRQNRTITVSKGFANNLRELAYLLGDKRPLAEFLDEHCGWVLVNLVAVKASTGGEWCDIISEIAPWDTEAECQAFVDRVRPKFVETAIFEVYQDDEGTWDISEHFTHLRPRLGFSLGGLFVSKFGRRTVSLRDYAGF